MGHLLGGGDRTDDLCALYKLVAVAVVAVAVGVHERRDVDAGKRSGHRIEHCPGEREVEQGVDEEGLIPVDDQAGIAPTPPTVGLHPRVIVATEIEEAMLVRASTELQHERHRSLRT